MSLIGFWYRRPHQSFQATSLIMFWSHYRPDSYTVICQTHTGLIHITLLIVSVKWWLTIPCLLLSARSHKHLLVLMEYVPLLFFLCSYRSTVSPCLCYNKWPNLPINIKQLLNLPMLVWQKLFSLVCSIVLFRLFPPHPTPPLLCTSSLRSSVNCAFLITMYWKKGLPLSKSTAQ